MATEPMTINQALIYELFAYILSLYSRLGYSLILRFIELKLTRKVSLFSSSTKKTIFCVGNLCIERKQINTLCI